MLLIAPMALKSTTSDGYTSEDTSPDLTFLAKLPDDFVYPDNYRNEYQPTSLPTLNEIQKPVEKPGDTSHTISRLTDSEMKLKNTGNVRNVNVQQVVVFIRQKN